MSYISFQALIGIIKKVEVVKRQMTKTVQLVKTNRRGILSELISYVGDSKCDESVTVFKLSDLVKLYNERMSQVCPNRGSVHSTQLQDRLLKQTHSLRSE